MSLNNKLNIDIFQGSTFFLNLTLRNADGSLKSLVNTTARMQIRDSYCSNTLIESLSTNTGEITIDSGTSTLNIVLAASRTANIAVDTCYDDSIPPRTRYVYDLEIQQPGDIVTKILYGEAIVYAEVTK